ncbi:MAG: hypothetical protein JWO14_3908 [Solirubrobacterales bacterium]|nr:hypothetical protein [Solirubrobacterales bacterium]
MVLSALGLVALAILVLGCGGGSSGSSEEGSETATLTRAEILNQANAICKQSQVLREKRYNVANEWLEEAGGHMTPPLRKKIIRYMVVSPVESLGQELKNLGSSNGNGKAIERYATTLGEEAVKARAKPLTVASGYAFAAADKRAGGLGLTNCAL